MTPNDPIVALWQTAPKPDTRQILRDLQRHNRLHRRLNVALTAILCLVTLLLISEEASRRLATQGWLGLSWLLCLATIVLWHRRAQTRRSRVLDNDTVNLLRFMIRQAKTDLFLARCLYAGVPLGAALGWLAMQFTGIGPATPPLAGNPQLRLLLAGMPIALLFAMMATGVILARSRRIQVRELGEKLATLNTDL